MALSAIAVLAFFFLAIILAAGAMLAAVLLVRFWWLARKGGRVQARGAIEGEYVTVEPNDGARDAAALPNRPSHRARDVQ